MNNFFNYINAFKLKMASWLSTIYLIGTFTCLVIHQFGYDLDTTILSILATGAVSVVMNLLNNNKKDEEKYKYYNESDIYLKNKKEETI